jgi:hypothetical protein
VQNSQAFALQTLMAAFPEFHGLSNVQQISAALQVLQQNNPQRHAAAVQHLHRVDALGKQAAAVQQQQQQQVAAQVHRWSVEQDALMDSYLAKNESPDVVKNVKQNLGRITKQVYGIEPTALAQALQTTPALRSFEFQRLLYDATRWQLANEGISEKVSKPIPQVQRPGTSQPTASRDHAGVAEAKAKFLKNPNDFRAAAAYVTAKRNADRS